VKQSYGRRQPWQEARSENHCGIEGTNWAHTTAGTGLLLLGGTGLLQGYTLGA
jgi:hypothetical protein